VLEHTGAPNGAKFYFLFSAKNVSLLITDNTYLYVKVHVKMCSKNGLNVKITSLVFQFFKSVFYSKFRLLRQTWQIMNSVSN
jgi:hypothetical protein